MQLAPERSAVIIDDDADVRNLVAAILQQAGFTSIIASNGPEGIEAIREHQPILTTLDVSMPGIDGFEVARRIRSFSTTYVIMLSARDEEIDTLMGLDAGADDYVTKPFRPRELRARVEAMLRRVHQYESQVETSQVSPAAAGSTPTPAASAAGERPEPQPDRVAADTDVEAGWLQHNELRIHPEIWECELDGQSVELTRSEFELLLSLVEGRRRVINKNELALRLRGGQAGEYVLDADRRAVEVHMANLRRKLGDPVNSPRFIETVRGVGYRLTPPLRTLTAGETGRTGLDA
ncbi:MAG: response regulator transcription factor [Microlunatus sp.]